MNISAQPQMKVFQMVFYSKHPTAHNLNVVTAGCNQSIVYVIRTSQEANKA